VGYHLRFDPFKFDLYLCRTFTRQGLLNRNTLFILSNKEGLFLMTKSPSQNKQSEKLNKVVDKALNQILGQEATQIIYDYVENNHNIQRYEIAEKLDSFNHALKEYLGSAAVVVGKVIQQNLELGGLDENKGVDFSEQHKLLTLA